MENRLDSLEATDILGADPAIGSIGGGKLNIEQVKLYWVRSIELQCRKM